MTTASKRPIWLRLFHMVPILGWMVRDVDRHGEDNFVWGIVTVFTSWGCAILLFGYPGLIIPALILAPIILILLLAVTWG